MTELSSTTTRRVRLDDLRASVIAVLEQLELPAEDAGLIADVLIDGDLRGHDDHGVLILRPLLRFYQSGGYNPRPAIRVVSETAGALVLDGDGGCGVMPAMWAMRWCIDRAREHGGMACAAVRHSGHALAAAPYVAMAAEAGLIGFACTNSSPLMAAPGGKSPSLGTNPFAFGLPTGQHPIIFDMATSTVSALKLLSLGPVAPDGLIADADGQPTSDSRAFWAPPGPPVGLIQPLGYPHAPHKGFGLALVVDALAGVLSGGAFARAASVPGADVGQFFWALDIAAFMAPDEFRARMDAQIEQITSGERLEGVEALYAPGQRGQRRRVAMLVEGSFPLSDAVWDALGQICATFAVPMPIAIEP